MRNKTFNVPNVCYLKKIKGYHGGKRRKLIKIVRYLSYVENCVFLAVFYVFHNVNLIFFLNNKSLDYLNVLLCIFFVSGVFFNFDVDFWPLLKTEKVLPPKQFWRGKKFLQNFIFNHPYESINF